MRIAGLSAALGLLACSSAPSRPMSSGERMYRAKCTSCHRAYQPHEQTPERWSKTIDKMEAEKKVRLAPEERAEILGYLAGSPSLR